LAVVDEKVHVWPAQGDCPAAQPHGAEPAACGSWVAEAVAPKKGVVVGVPELVGVGVFEGVGVSELVGVGVFEGEVPGAAVLVVVGVSVGVGVSELVGVGVFEGEVPGAAVLVVVGVGVIEGVCEGDGQSDSSVMRPVEQDAELE
jgi:hypothetical protein